jgi:hypothetical protein
MLDTVGDCVTVHTKVGSVCAWSATDWLFSKIDHLGRLALAGDGQWLGTCAR